MNTLDPKHTCNSLQTEALRSIFAYLLFLSSILGHMLEVKTVIDQLVPDSLCVSL